MANDGRRWFERQKGFSGASRSAAATLDGPDLWTRCEGCGETLYNDALAANARVCHNCGHHFRISAVDRLRLICDEGSVTLHDEDLAPVDALGFVDSKAYPVRIEASQGKTGRNDAFLALSAEIDGIPVEIGSFDFAYMGGSMGSVVGECVTRLYERAAERGVPAIVISASGGARMQEGVLSLMQMAKTCAALGRLQEKGLPYISLLTFPTTGGVAASFAMLGDLILSEPKALIGFAGPRVIQQTIGQELPPGFQTAEYLLEHGMIDSLVDRAKLKPTLSRLMRQMLKLPPSETFVDRGASDGRGPSDPASLPATHPSAPPRAVRTT